MPECYFYILFSKTKDRFYIGSTCDSVEERLRKHNSNHKGFTGGSAHWKLVYHEGFPSKIEALRRERLVKGWKSRKMIIKLINSGNGSVGPKHPDQ